MPAPSIVLPLIAEASSNTEETNSNSYNFMSGGNATLGVYISGTFGMIVGAGFHIREELAPGECVTIVGGFG